MSVLGLRGHAALYAALAAKPMDYAGLALAGKLSDFSARRWAQSLHAAGLVHITRWQRIGRGQPTPVWAAGPGTDAPYPAQRPDGSPAVPRPVQHPKRRYSSTVAFCVALRALQTGAHTLADMMEETGVSVRGVRGMLYTLHAARVLYISAWHRPNGATGKWCAAYAWGRAKDAEKPAPEPNTSVCRRHRQRLQERKTLATLLRLGASSNQPTYRNAA
jgi:hypothetical protein